MSNHLMQVSLQDHLVRCETKGLLVSLNDLVVAGNVCRARAGRSAKNLADIRSTQSYSEFREAVASKTGVPSDKLEVKKMGRGGGTMGHIYLAVYIAEQMSPEFHVEVISTFVDGKLLETRELGGVIFSKLNTALAHKMLEWENREAHKGHFIAVAKALKVKIIGEDGNWNTTSVQQTQLRYEHEYFLVKMLNMGFINSWVDMKNAIEKL